MHSLTMPHTSAPSSIGLAPLGPVAPAAPPDAGVGSEQLERQVKRADEAIRALAGLQLPPQAQPNSRWSTDERLASIDLIFQQLDAEGSASRPSE